MDIIQLIFASVALLLSLITMQQGLEILRKLTTLADKMGALTKAINSLVRLLKKPDIKL